MTDCEKAAGKTRDERVPTSVYQGTPEERSSPSGAVHPSCTHGAAPLRIAGNRAARLTWAVTAARSRSNCSGEPTDQERRIVPRPCQIMKNAGVSHGHVRRRRCPVASTRTRPGQGERACQRFPS